MVEDEDRQFASAVESAYLSALAKLDHPEDKSMLALHEELLEEAIYHADRGRGGIRFKKLSDSRYLDERLLRALSLRLDQLLKD